MKFTKYITLIIIVLATSCKSYKNVSDAGISTISTKKIINNHYNNSFNQKTIYAKLSAKYKGKKASATVSVKLRLEKDKTIWLSATKLGFPLAKVKITPTRVSYYEKLSKTYFDGDFTLLSNFLGTELDYKKVQNILLGQAVMNLRKGKYISEISEKKYQLEPKRSNDIFDILFFLNPDNFKVNKQEIKNSKEKQLLTVSYPVYNEIKGEQFPKKIDIRAVDDKEITTINIEYKSVEFNKELTFPFKIPAGYKEISLK